MKVIVEGHTYELAHHESYGLPGCPVQKLQFINKVKQEKLVQLSPNREPIEPGTEAHKEFNTWWDEMLESEVEIELRTVQYLKLNPEKNGIPMEVIASLGKMVEYPTDEELAALEESQKKKEV